MTDHVHATGLSCQGLTWIDESIDPPTFHGQIVDGYREEITRRGEDHVYGCELIGHLANDDTDTRNY